MMMRWNVIPIVSQRTYGTHSHTVRPLYVIQRYVLWPDRAERQTKWVEQRQKSASIVRYTSFDRRSFFVFVCMAETFFVGGWLPLYHVRVHDSRERSLNNIRKYIMLCTLHIHYIRLYMSWWGDAGDVCLVFPRLNKCKIALLKVTRQAIRRKENLRLRLSQHKYTIQWDNSLVLFFINSKKELRTKQTCRMKWKLKYMWRGSSNGATTREYTFSLFMIPNSQKECASPFFL